LLAGLAGALFAWRGWRSFLVLATALACLSIGGLVLSEQVGRWIIFTTLGLFVALFIVLVITASWEPRLAWSLAALLLFGVGSFCHSTGQVLRRFIDVIGSLDLELPWLWLLLGLIPLTIASWRGLGITTRSLEPGLTRRRLAFAAR